MSVAWGRARNVGACVLVLALLAACLPKDRGTAIADSIRDVAHPLVRTIEYSGDGDESGPLMTIMLQPGATEAEAIDFTCAVVFPAIEAGSPPEEFVFDVLDSTGEVLLASETAQCRQ